MLAAGALCSLTGLCFGMAAPPSDWSALAWIAPLPLLVALRRWARSVWQAAVFGWIAGLGVGLVGFPWIAELLMNFTGAPALLAYLCLVVFSGWMAVPYALWAAGVFLGPARGLGAILWPIVLLTSALELWPALFPYTPVIGLASIPSWIQLAEIGGVHLVEAQVLAFAGLLALGLGPTGPRERVVWFALAATIPLASAGLGAQRIRTLERSARDAPAITVGVIQPNTPVLFGNVEESMRRLRESSAAAEAEGAELIIWPEAGAYPFALERPVEREPADPRARILLLHSSPTLLGALTIEPGARFGYNSLLYLDPEGRVRGRFDKVELVPFGERIPWVEPEWAQQFIPAMGHLFPGAGPVRFAVELPRDRQIGVGPLICYEDIIPSFAHSVAAQPGGIELFVNATIDAWYGAGAEPWEHLALAQFRSVEHRIPLVRAVSTGVSAVIDHTGRRIAELPARAGEPGILQHSAETLVTQVRLPRNTAAQPTFFARFGWLFPVLCQLATAVAVLVWVWRRWRTASHPPAAGESRSEKLMPQS